MPLPHTHLPRLLFLPSATLSPLCRIARTHLVNSGIARVLRSALQPTNAM